MRKFLKTSRIIKSLLLAVSILALIDQFAANNCFQNSEYLEDPELFWRHSPGYHQCAAPGKFFIINSLGLREPDNKIEHPSIMMLGDSCTFGMDVSEGETIDAYLENIINKQGKSRIRVYNAGCSGYSSLQMLSLFRHIAPLYKSDIVFCAPLYGDTDFSDITDKSRLSGGILLTVRKILWKSGIYRFLTSQSHPQPDCAAPFTGNAIRVSPEEYRENIGRIRELAENNGSKLFIILFYPRPLQNRYDCREGKYKEAALSLQNEHTIVIDLLEKWDLTGDSRKDLFLDILHPNSQGYKKAAEDIYSILSSRQEYLRLLKQ